MAAPYVFISYKSEDIAFARELVDALKAVGLGSWAAFTSVRLSHAREIPPAIQNASAVVILMSSRAYASEEVLDEVYLAREFKRLRLSVLLPGEVDPVLMEGLADDIKNNWRLERARSQYHPWGTAENVAQWVADAIADRGILSAPVESAPLAPVGSIATENLLREPLALVSSLGLTYQLYELDGLGENLLDEGDRIATNDLGLVVLAPDGSVIATLDRELGVSIWTHGSAAPLRGPVLEDVLPTGAGRVRLLAIERPIGQAIRIVAARGGTAYSVFERQGNTWVAEEIATGEEEFVGAAPVLDDLLLVREGGDTVWAGDHAKRPFGLRSVRGVDSAFGPDGRQYLAGWGTGMDGSSHVEAVVGVDRGWERVHRGPGDRAGIIRVLSDADRYTPEQKAVTIAVQSPSDDVNLISIES